jgi:hypothetical protein
MQDKTRHLRRGARARGVWEEGVTRGGICEWTSDEGSKVRGGDEERGGGIFMDLAVDPECTVVRWARGRITCQDINNPNFRLVHAVAGPRPRIITN